MNGDPQRRRDSQFRLLLALTGAALMLFDGPLRMFGASYLALALGLWVVSVRPQGAADEGETAALNHGSEVHRFWVIASATAAFAAIAGLGAITVVYGVNFPFFDEFAATLRLVTEFPDMPFADRIGALFAPHHGHRIVTTRLAALADTIINGQLNVVHLMLLGYAFLAGSAALLFASYARSTRAPVLFAPFALVVFQPQFHQLTLWGFSVQHFSGLFFQTLTFILLARPGRASLVFAIAALTAATYSFGNGILVGFLGLVYLCAQKRRRDALVWFVAVTALALLYFHGLSLGRGSDSSAGWIPRLWYLLEFLGSSATLGAFSDFLGAKDAEVVSHPGALWLSRATGALVIAAFAHLTAQRYWNRNFPVYGLLALTIASAALAAQQRIGAPYTSPFMSRYTLNSALSVGLVYLAIAELHLGTARRKLPAVLAVASLYCAASYAITLPYVRLHSGDMRFSALIASNSLYEGATQGLATPLFDLNGLRNAADQGAYTVPRGLLERFLMDPVEVPLAEEERNEPVIVYRGENEYAFTYVIAAPAKPSAVGRVILSVEDSAGTVRAFPTAALSGIPIHQRLLDNSGFKPATHLVCIPKASLTGAPQSVWTD